MDNRHETGISPPNANDRIFRPEDLAHWCGGHWENPPPRIRGFTHDSRRVAPGNLYIAISGAKRDGHDFVPDVLRAGAAAALVRTDWQPPPSPEGGANAGAPPPSLLRVSDTRQALLALGNGYRRRVAPFIIGVTGSIGKSTVKEWTAALLATIGPTAATSGNFNTDVGLPLSLLQMAPETRLGVFELGMNHPGEIAPLARTLEPQAAIICALAPVHLEAFASMEAIADEKAALLRQLPASGFAVLDAASPWFDFLRRQTAARVVTVSLGPAIAADYQAEDIREGTGDFTLTGRAADHPRSLSVGLPGRHNILNLLLAIAAARSCGAAWEAIEEALHRLPRMPMRWEQRQWHGMTVINDAYNASPAAMEAAIRAFAAAATGHRRVLVLGEMRELGPDAERLHAASGACVAECGGDLLIAVGKGGGWIAETALRHGFGGDICRVDDAREAGAALARLTRAGDWVLLKASRGVALEGALSAWQDNLENH